MDQLKKGSGNKFLLIAVIVLFVLVLGGGTFALAQKGYFSKATKIVTEKDACRDSKAVEDSRSSVVRIQTVGKDKTVYGTGFWTEDGKRIITNSHVVDLEGGVITVYSSDATVTSAQLLSNDIYHDLAILTVPEGKFVQGLKWGNSSDLKAPDTLIALGYSLNLPGEASVTKGSFSARRNFEDTDYLQSDTAVNPGNSGGPLIDTCGKVVGINTLSSENSTVNIAISAESAEKYIDDMIKTPQIAYFAGAERKTVLSEFLKTAGLEAFTSAMGIDKAASGQSTPKTVSASSNKTKSSNVTAPACYYVNATVGNGALISELEVGQSATLSFTGTANPSWSGGGTFSDVSGSTAKWKSAQPGDFTLTAKLTNSAGECQKSVSIKVWGPVTSIPGLKRVSMINLFEPTFSKTLGKDALRMGLGYQSETGADLSWNIPRSGQMAISADVEVYMSNPNNQGDRVRKIYSGHFSNSNIGFMYEGSNSAYREILIPRDQISVSDSDYTNNSIMCAIDLTLHTPEQGDFKSSGYGSLLKY